MTSYKYCITTSRGKMNICVLAVILLYLIPGCCSSSLADRKKLHDVLMNDYKRNLLPVKNISKSLEINIGFEVVRLVGLDSVDQSFTFSGQFNVSWKDASLTWDPKDYGRTIVMKFEQQSLWRPDLFLPRSLITKSHLGFDEMPIHVEHNGKVTWEPVDRYKLSCTIDVTYFPFDVQICDIFISTWTSMDELTFTFDGSYFQIGRKNENMLWRVQLGKISTVESANKRPVLIIPLRCERRPSYYIFNFIVPVILLSFLNVLVFLLPVDSGEKISFTITALLSFFVFLTLLGDALPISSKKTSNLALYIFSLLTQSFLTLVATVCVLAVYHQPTSRPLPAWLQCACSVLKRSPKKMTRVRAKSIVYIAEKRNESCGESKTPLVSDVSWKEVASYLDRIFWGLFTFGAVASAAVFFGTTVNRD